MKIKDFFTKQEITLNKEVSLYVCGPTVYNHHHIGNMRPIILFDIFNKVASLENEVTFVHNITDVDDKIIAQAKKDNITEQEVATKYENEYLDLLEKLNIKKPTHMPRVTDNINGIINFINELVKKGFAYESNGSIYFSVPNFGNYSKLDNILLDKLIVDESSKDKRDSKDFALWKKTDEGIQFKSPWGKGRPGWHTECAYLVRKYFGNEGIDVHGGGIDLKFPHHINEMAQYEANTGNNIAMVWSYVGHLTVEDIKMSKSEGNFITAKDFINEHGAKTLRYILISTSASKPINLTEEVILNAKNALSKFSNVIRKTLIDLSVNSDEKLNIEPTTEFVEVISDDLDTPAAITYLMDTVKMLNSEKNIYRKEELVEGLIANLSLLGFDYEIKFDELRKDIKIAKENSDFDLLDKLREDLIK